MGLPLEVMTGWRRVNHISNYERTNTYGNDLGLNCKKLFTAVIKSVQYLARVFAIVSHLCFNLTFAAKLERTPVKHSNLAKKY